MENFLNLNKLTAGALYQPYRKAIWLYLFLLIFEGALRKWFLPSLATPLLLVRDPIAIWLTLEGMRRGWLTSGYVKTMMVVSTVSLILTWMVGHQNFLVGIFGWRIYFFHFPMVFVMGKVLNRDDLMKMARFILLLSIPMTILITIQFYSPQSAWVNLGVGGEGSSGFQGATVGGVSYFRPSGTFSFTQGYVSYQALVGCLLLYYLVVNGTLKRQYRFPLWLLIAFAAAYIVSIPTSISRTHFFQSLVFVAFLFWAVINKPRLKVQFLRFLVIGVIAVLLISLFGKGGASLEAFTNRFDMASKTEGGVQGTLGDRYFGGLLDGLLNFNIPFFGYGIGLGTNVGAKLMGGNMYSFGFNGENEWGRIVGECGMLLGWIIIGVRLLFSLDLLKRAYFKLKRRFDLMPWMLSAGMMLNIPQGQWSIPTNLGFCILFAGFTLASVNNDIYSKK